MNIYMHKFEIEMYTRKISVFFVKYIYAIYVLCGCGSELVYINIYKYIYFNDLFQNAMDSP